MKVVRSSILIIFARFSIKHTYRKARAQSVFIQRKPGTSLSFLRFAYTDYTFLTSHTTSSQQHIEFENLIWERGKSESHSVGRYVAGGLFDFARERREIPLPLSLSLSFPRPHPPTFPLSSNSSSFVYRFSALLAPGFTAGEQPLPSSSTTRPSSKTNYLHSMLQSVALFKGRPLTVLD